MFGNSLCFSGNHLKKILEYGSSEHTPYPKNRPPQWKTRIEVVFLLLRDLAAFKIFLAESADGTVPIIGDILEFRARSYPVGRTAEHLVIRVSAGTEILFHVKHFLSFRQAVPENFAENPANTARHRFKIVCAVAAFLCRARSCHKNRFGKMSIFWVEFSCIFGAV